MNPSETLARLERQRTFFQEGYTLSVSARMDALKRLRGAILEMEDAINAALRADLGKSAGESYMCETGMVLAEIHHMLRHGRAYARKRRVATPLAQFPASSDVLPCPLGNVLIISPWNYPFLLALDPAVDAIAAGNTVVIKPSAQAPETARVLDRVISRALPPEWAFVAAGGREESGFLLDCPFDMIFFTGSANTGRVILEKAAAHLTPAVLELGGKSPCIVDETADIPLAARRIIFGKMLNCGQTCVAPDYVYCHRSVHDDLVRELKRQIAAQYGERPLENPDYGRIVNERQFDRLLRLMDESRIVHGGGYDRERLRVEPTILDGVIFGDPVMEEEIFGPILPVLTYDTLDEALGEIERRPHPLALYLFSSDKAIQSRVMTRLRFGGGCVNDTIVHLATANMPFGGVGGSGMGAYHGKAGFEAFTHFKSIVNKNTWLDLPVRYSPYTYIKKRLVRRFLK